MFFFGIFPNLGMEYVGQSSSVLHNGHAFKLPRGEGEEVDRA